MGTTLSHVPRTSEVSLVRPSVPAEILMKVFGLSALKSEDCLLRAGRSAALSARRSCSRPVRSYLRAKPECPLESTANRLRLQRLSEIQAGILRRASTNHRPPAGNRFDIRVHRPDCRMNWDSVVAETAKRTKPECHWNKTRYKNIAPNPESLATGGGVPLDGRQGSQIDKEWPYLIQMKRHRGRTGAEKVSSLRVT